VELEEKKKKKEEMFFRDGTRERRDAVRTNKLAGVQTWLKKLHERVNNDERRNARAREKSLLERREKQS